MNRRSFTRPVVLAVLLAAQASAATAADCTGAKKVPGLGGAPQAWQLADGGVAAYAKLNVNIDGYERAYHPRNAEAGALIHLCNAGEVYLPDGSAYHGSKDNPTCTGRFMRDIGRIGAAGWSDPSVGVVRWYGVLGQGTATTRGRAIRGIVPVLQKSGSGFYVSPTALFDSSITDETEQSRYVNPLRIAAAVVSKDVVARGVAMGSSGVAYNTTTKIAVPFVVGDRGPRIGEGSLALGRLAKGLPLKDTIARNERYLGQVDQRDVLWVFFKDSPLSFDSRDEAATTTRALAAYESWGGDARLARCIEQLPDR